MKKQYPPIKPASIKPKALPPATGKVVREAEAALMIQIPITTMKSLKSKALDKDMTMRAFVLQALKKAGVDVSEETLRDRRK